MELAALIVVAVLAVVGYLSNYLMARRQAETQLALVSLQTREATRSTIQLRLLERRINTYDELLIATAEWADATERLVGAWSAWHTASEIDKPLRQWEYQQCYGRWWEVVGSGRLRVAMARIAEPEILEDLQGLQQDYSLLVADTQLLHQAMALQAWQIAAQIADRQARTFQRARSVAMRLTSWVQLHLREAVLATGQETGREGQ